jgi:hypothetical protein
MKHRQSAATMLDFARRISNMLQAPEGDRSLFGMPGMTKIMETVSTNLVKDGEVELGRVV